jgi:hypothetical protein
MHHHHLLQAKNRGKGLGPIKLVSHLSKINSTICHPLLSLYLHGERVTKSKYKDQKLEKGQKIKTKNKKNPHSDLTVLVPKINRPRVIMIKNRGR